MPPLISGCSQVVAVVITLRNKAESASVHPQQISNKPLPDAQLSLHLSTLYKLLINLFQMPSYEAGRDL